MLESGSEGAANQAQVVEAYGGRVIIQCALAGHYDAMLFVEFPSEAACRALVLSAASSGQTVDDLRAFSPTEIDEASALALAATEMLQKSGSEH